MDCCPCFSNTFLCIIKASQSRKLGRVTAEIIKKHLVLIQGLNPSPSDIGIGMTDSKTGAIYHIKPALVHSITCTTGRRWLRPSDMKDDRLCYVSYNGGSHVVKWEREPLDNEYRKLALLSYNTDSAWAGPDLPLSP